FAITGRIAEPVGQYYEGLNWKAWPAPMQLQHAQRLSSAAYHFWVMGRFREANGLATSAMEIRRIHVVDHPLLAESLNLLGTLRHELRDLEGARSLFEESLDI